MKEENDRETTGGVSVRNQLLYDELGEMESRSLSGGVHSAWKSLGHGRPSFTQVPGQGSG